MSDFLLYRLIGKTISIKTLICDKVMDGVFFPQFDFNVPKKKVCKYAGEHVMVPPVVFSYFIMVHSKFILTLPKTLFNSPAQTGQPNKSLKPGAGRGVAYIVRIFRIIAYSSFDYEPDSLIG